MKYSTLNIKHQRGTSLYFALIIMTIMLAMALGLSSIFIGQTKTIKQIGDSVIAFYAADAGIEKILLVRNNPPLGTGSVVELGNGATYQVIVTTGADCLHYCIRSIGSYLGTKRAVEVTY